MSRSLNKVMLIGNVGQDPEIRATRSGKRVANVSLATNRTWTDEGGQRQEKVEWHRLAFFGAVVDVIERFVKKGDRLYVEGRIEYSKDDKGGFWTNIICFEMVMLGSSDGARREQPATADASPWAPTGGPSPAPDEGLPF